MLYDIKTLSKKAQDIISEQISDENNENNENYLQQLKELHEDYVKIVSLINAAEGIWAVIGLCILSYQLKNKHADLNAVELMQTFTDIMSYSPKTHLEGDIFEIGSIEVLKIVGMSFIQIDTMMFFMHLLPEMIALSTVPWILLSILLLSFTVPLLLAYCYDKPYSMSRWYQEIAGLEKFIAYTLLIWAGLSLFDALTLAVMMATWPSLVLVLALQSSLIVGLCLLQHSQVLEKKHDSLCSYQSTNKPSACGFFDDVNNTEAKSRLQNIKLSSC